MNFTFNYYQILGLTSESSSINKNTGNKVFSVKNIFRLKYLSKRLSLFHISFFLLFFCVTKGPRNDERIIAAPKSASSLISLEMGLLFSWFFVIFQKLQNIHFVANRLNIEKLSNSKLDKIKFLYFECFGLFFDILYGHFINFTWVLLQNPP